MQLQYTEKQNNNKTDDPKKSEVYQCRQQWTLTYFPTIHFIGFSTLYYNHLTFRKYK